MKKINKVLNSTILAPILLAVYPILALWAYNFDRMEPIEVVFPLILSIFGSLILLLLLRLCLRNSVRASLITSLMVLLFFTYGHVLGLIKNLPTIGPLLAHQRYLSLLWR